MTPTYATQVIADLKRLAPPTERLRAVQEHTARTVLLAQHFTLGFDDETISQFFNVDRSSLLATPPYPFMSISHGPYFFLCAAPGDGRARVVAFQRCELQGRPTWVPINYVVDLGGVIADGKAQYAYFDDTVDQSSEFREFARQLLAAGACRFVALVNALSCTNINAETCHPAPPAKINERRAREGKPPLFETKTLTIHVNPRAPSAHGSGTGGHASPRQHLRRGHIRRLESGKNVWVQPHVVGDASRGSITKTYRVVA